jgi:hypothetical protein
MGTNLVQGMMGGNKSSSSVPILYVTNYPSFENFLNVARLKDNEKEMLTEELGDLTLLDEMIRAAFEKGGQQNFGITLKEDYFSQKIEFTTITAMKLLVAAKKQPQ